MLAGITLVSSFVGDLAKEETILEQPVQCRPCPAIATCWLFAFFPEDFGAVSLTVDHTTGFSEGFGLGKEFVEVANLFRLLFIDHQLAVFNVIAESCPSAHPHTLLLGESELVPNPPTGHLPFKLGKGEQDIEGQAPHASGGIELLGYCDKGGVVLIEEFDQFGKVCQRAGE